MCTRRGKIFMDTVGSMKHSPRLTNNLRYKIGRCQLGYTALLYHQLNWFYLQGLGQFISNVLIGLLHLCLRLPPQPSIIVRSGSYQILQIYRGYNIKHDAYNNNLLMTTPTQNHPTKNRPMRTNAHYQNVCSVKLSWFSQIYCY